MTFSHSLEKVAHGGHLAIEEMTEIMEQMMTGQLTPAQIGAILMALRIKGETVDEITAGAQTMRRHATKIDAGEPPIVDTCGTGGDGRSTFNISTTAAIIAAGAGVKVAKHGNRSVSSKCGSADVLAELGVNTGASPELVGRCVREIGIGFLFAPALHGAMKHAIGPRRELGVRTMFNMLGPLTNPAGATAQLIGVFSQDLTPVFAEVLGKLGVQRALVVHGLDGSDELTGVTNSQVSELRDGTVTTTEFDPQPYIGQYCRYDDLKAGDAAESAAIIRAILDGESGPRSEVAILNAGAVIYVAGLAPDIAGGVAKARQAIASGAAADKLQQLVKLSNT